MKAGVVAAVVIALIVGVAAGYFIGAGAVPAATVTETSVITQVSTITETVGAEGVVTETVTVTETQVQTVTVTETQVVTAAPEKPVVKLGILLPLTGGAAESGQEDLRGIQLLAKHVNEGRFPNLRFRLELVIADTQSKPEVGSVEVRNLEAQGVVAIIGAYQSSVTYPSANVANELKLPFIVTEAIADKITEQGWEYVFRTNPKASWYARDVVKMIVDFNEKFGTNFKTIALIYENTDFGVSTTEGIKEWLQELMPDAQIVHEESYPFETITSMDEMVATLKALNPDIVIHTGYLRDTVLFVQTLKKLDWYPKAYIGAGAGGQARIEFIEQLGVDAEFVFAQTEWQPDLLEAPGISKWRWVAEDYENEFNRPMTGSSAMNYAGAYAVAVAIQAALDAGADPNDVRGFREALREALSKTVIEDVPLVPWEKIDLTTEDRQNPYAVIPIAQIRDGTFKIVWPIGFATIDPAWPSPAWGER